MINVGPIQPLVFYYLTSVFFTVFEPFFTNVVALI